MIDKPVSQAAEDEDPAEAVVRVAGIVKNLLLLIPGDRLDEAAAMVSHGLDGPLHIAGSTSHVSIEVLQKVRGKAKQRLFAQGYGVIGSLEKAAFDARETMEKLKRKEISEADMVEEVQQHVFSVFVDTPLRELTSKLLSYEQANAELQRRQGATIQELR